MFRVSFFLSFSICVTMTSQLFVNSPFSQLSQTSKIRHPISFALTKIRLFLGFGPKFYPEPNEFISLIFKKSFKICSKKEIQIKRMLSFLSP